MNPYLKRRFPLDNTSTVYMNGKAVYNLVRRDRPGIIAPVELHPADAEAFRDAVRAAMAEAWDEGHRAGHEEARAVHAACPNLTPNPYRADELEADQ